MDLPRWMQTLHSRPLPENRFELREKPICMRKTQERLFQTISDLPHLSRLRLRHAIGLQSGPASSLVQENLDFNGPLR